MSVIPAVVSQLLEWSKENGRHSLPWRKHGITPYEVWVSEIMLQQTQVSRVIPYYERFLERFPSVQDVARSSWEEFLPYYAGLGYYSRGRNMQKAALKVVEEFGGSFPRDEAALRSLPGVGPYTAKAILSFGFGDPHLAFDTNQQRVFARVLYGNRREPLDPLMLEKEIPTQTEFRTLNGAVMDFANAVCTRSPKCAFCPLKRYCRYFQTDGRLEPKAKSAKSIFPTQEASVILILHSQHQQYYSSQSDRYEPFQLPKSLTSRAQVKEYFRRIHDLELAVRPPHRKGWLDGHPVLLVNAQILLGDHSFPSFPKDQAKPILEQLQHNLVEE